MVVLRALSEFGIAPHPRSENAVITNLPGWDMLVQVRDGDFSPLARVIDAYPRFSPRHGVAQLGQQIADRLGIVGRGSMVYLDPDTLEYTARHASSKARDKHAISRDELILKCVDVGSHRLYCVFFEPQHVHAVMASWGHPGVGISNRGAQGMLKAIAEEGGFAEVSVDEGLAAPTWTPEGPAHQALRERINELLHRAAINPAHVTCTPKDVYLYPSGMAAIHRANVNLVGYRPGIVVALGVVYHATHEHFKDEHPDNYKHFGRVDDAGMDELEAWMLEAVEAGKIISHLIVETPGNPTLDMPDLARLKRLADKCGFVHIIDDTIGGFGNLDVLDHCDILISSLTKTFNGFADALGGSTVLNPRSQHYAPLSPLFTSSHRNDLFADDATALVANARSFLSRTHIHNRNAAAMAAHLQRLVSDPRSPVARVRYPSLDERNKRLYDAVMRRPDQDLPEPGYGCLLTVDFDSVAAAKAFYDRCGFYPSPHLGGHCTLQLPYSLLSFGREKKDREYFRGFDALEEGIRISSGLEDVSSLIQTLEDGLAAATEAKKANAS